MAIEPAEAVDRAEPQKAARVLDDAEDAVVAEAISRRIRAGRQAFRERLRSDRAQSWPRTRVASSPMCHSRMGNVQSSIANGQAFRILFWKRRIGD